MPTDQGEPAGTLPDVGKVEFEDREGREGAIFFGPAFDLEPPAVGKGRCGHWRPLTRDERLIREAAYVAGQGRSGEDS